MALARVLVDKGWHVFVADCDAAALAALDGERGMTPVPLDVTSNDSVHAAFDTVQQHTRHLDAVVNFAGILRVGPMIEIEEPVLRQVLEINLLGTWRVNKAFFPLLRHGRIVNISSETGWHTASPFNGAYAMSKYAIEAYSDALRRELSIFGIPVIKIQPGPFRTALVSNTVDGFYAAAKSSRHYASALRYFGDLVREANGKAAEPAELAEVIHEALTARYPKAAYSVRADARRSFLEWLPLRLSDRIYRNILGNPGNQ